MSLALRLTLWAKLTVAHKVGGFIYFVGKVIQLSKYKGLEIPVDLIICLFIINEHSEFVNMVISCPCIGHHYRMR